MRRIESIDDQMKGVVTFEFLGGKRLCVDARMARTAGPDEIWQWARSMGIVESDEPLPVWQFGRRIGTLPASFDPMFMESESWFYDPRPDDFKRVDNGWEASKALGPGDLDAVPRFRWDDADYEAGRAARNAEGRALLVAALTSDSDGSGEAVETAKTVSTEGESAGRKASP